MKEEIIEARTIKDRRKRIEYIYDRACKTIDDYWKDKNPCNFINGRCLNQNYPNCKYKNGCCRKCIYQSSTGCKTANLSCKFYYCSTVQNKFKILELKDIEILKLLSHRQRIILKHDYFASREEVLSDLYCGMITVFAFKLIFRNILKNITWKN